MRIIQHTPCLSTFDAVSNDVIEIHKVLDNLSVKNEIYAEAIDIVHKDIAKESTFLHVNNDDLLILHISTYSDFYHNVDSYKCKKVFFYHNITPPEFLIDLSGDIYENSRRGLEQAKELLDKVDFVCADSEFNASDVRKMGWKGEITIIPIVYDFNKRPNENENQKLKAELSKTTNILFVGRIVPNKKQQDILKAFIIYNKFFNSNSRLHLVGGSVDTDSFVQNIKRLAQLANVDKLLNVPGKVSDEDLVTYYKNSQLFLSMSEHEGFSVPMIESMHYELPVLAYFDSGALPETIGKGGIFFTEKDFSQVAFLIDEMIKNTELRKDLIVKMKAELEKFEYENVKTEFTNFLKKIEILK